MADEKEKSGGGFIKAIMSSAVGLVSGAIIMYVSPLVNSAIKPAKPVPNFSYTLEGAAATFNNRSTGATQGWWDFGDNSGLEPFAPNQAAMTHKFPGPGSFSVKLTLHNLIGEEAERTVSVKVNEQLPPAIDEFKVTPLSSNRLGTSNLPAVPATFRITGKLKNADLLIWSIDDHPLELVDVTGEAIDRNVTFDYYGGKKIRLMAVAGKNKVEKEDDVWVDVPDEEPILLVQQHSYAAKAKTIPISVSIPAQFNGPIYPFELVRDLDRKDATILEANLDRPSDQLVRNPKLVIAANKKSFTVSGELVRQNGAGGTTTSWFSKVELKVANQGALAVKRSDPVSAPLKLPGQTLLALPATTGGMAAGLGWELRQGMMVAYKDTKIPATQVVRLKDRTYHVTLTQVGGQLQCDAMEAPSVPFLSTSTPRK